MAAGLWPSTWQTKLKRLLLPSYAALRRGGRRLSLEWLEERVVPASVYTVLNTNDSGTGSFRQALQDATSGSDTIAFDISSSGLVQTISLLSTLTVNTPLIIDATTEPGYKTHPLIDIAGQGTSVSFDGLDVFAGNTTVRGLAINNFGGFGMVVSSGGNDVIQGNYIGTDANGTSAVTNGQIGIYVTGGSSNDTIGGVAAQDRNVISGNTRDAIYVGDSVLSGTVIIGNYLGVDATGTAALGNGSSGVVVNNGPTSTQIGGTTAGEGNVISGNGLGIFLGSATDTTIEGNYIGTNAAGTAAIGNLTQGIRAPTGSITSANIIGGTTAAARNIISGNGQDGITFYGSGVTDTAIEGNYIGTNAAGTAALANGNDGVHIYGGASSIAVGGTAAGMGNVISGNDSYGVEISDASTTANVIAGNYIGLNAAGSASIGNGYTGVILYNGTTDDTVGGSVSGARNVISGNGFVGLNSGVDIADSGTSNNVVAGNYVGTDASGSFAIPNEDDGVALFNSASNNVIGGTTAAEGNLLSGNSRAGVELFAGASNNVVEANQIGVNAAGTGALGNALYGVDVGSSASNFTVDNTIGGPVAGEGNVIANNGKGVVVTGNNSLGDAILGNSIYNNASIGIDLGDDGPTPNNPSDGTSGPNDFQNYPQTNAAWIDSAGDLLVSYSIDSDPALVDYPLHIEVFLADASGQGKSYAGADNFATTDYYNGGKVLNLGSAATYGVSLGSQLVLTATDANNDTSEFSAPISVTDTIEVTNTKDNGPGSLRQAITDANGDTTGANTITFAMTGDQTISVSSPLPAITAPVILDGTTEGGYSGTPLIEIDGTYTEGASGLVLEADGITIRALAIDNFTYFGDGIDVYSNNNVIVGNYLGVGLDGETAQGNASDGIFISGGDTNNIIGGTTTADRNVISANQGAGIEIGDYGGDSGNSVEGNYIGTNATGTAALGNLGAGVLLDSGLRDATTIANNVISSNQIGVDMLGASDVVVTGNIIGLNATGTVTLGNGTEGIWVTGGSSSIQIGGATAAEGNIITGSTVGVEVEAATGVAIEHNSIYGNSSIGIQLNNDLETGPNNLQSAPVTTWARIDGNGDLLLNYFVNSDPGMSAYPLHIEIFKADASGEGQSFVAVDNFTTSDFSNGGRVVDLGNAFAHGVSASDNLVLTATDADGNTSEFSAVVGVADTIEVTNASNSGLGSLRQAILDANSSGSANTVTFAMSGPQTIALLTPLPTIADPLVLDATTEGGYVGTPLIELSGGNLGPGATGLTITGGNSAVNGFTIDHFGTGIDLESGNGNLIENNVITNNTGSGIVVGSQDNQLLSNSIYADADPGIALIGAGDHGQNAPVIYTFDGTTITGALSAAPNTPYLLQFYTSSASGPARQGQTLVGEEFVTTDSTGTVNFTDVLSEDPSAVVLTGTATDEVTGDTSGFSAGPPVAAVAETTTLSTTANTAFGTPLSLTLTDAYGEPLAGVPVVFVAPTSGSSGTFAGGATSVTLFTDSTGTVSPTFTANTMAGTYNVTATVAGLSPLTYSLTNTPGTAKTFVLSTMPSTVAGVSQPLSVTVEDAFGNVVADYSGTVTFSSTDRQAVLPGLYTFTSADAGQHTFAVTLDTAGTQTISLSDGSLFGTTGNITVSPAAAARFVVTPAASVNQGAPLAVTVQALDAFNNTATGYSGTVAFSANDPFAQLSGPLALPGGLQTFANIGTLSVPGAHVLTVTDTASPSVTGSGSLIVVDVAPIVTLANSLTVVNVGAALNVTGSIIDPGVGVTFVGLVDYGDGSGLQSLPVNADGSFTLNHVYTQDGTDYVTVSVNDGHSGIGVASLLANVVYAGIDTGGVSVAATNGTGMATATANGITATLFTALGRQAFILVSQVPTSVTAGLLGAGTAANKTFIAESFDVRAIGVTSDDSVIVTFSYTGTNPVLNFVNAKGQLQAIEGSTDPRKGVTFSVNTVNHTITVVFDGTSTPQITDLRGTVFTITVNGESQQLALFQVEPSPTLAQGTAEPATGATDESTDVAVGSTGSGEPANNAAANGGDSGEGPITITPQNYLPPPPSVPDQQSTGVLSPSQPDTVSPPDNQSDKPKPDEDSQSAAPTLVPPAVTVLLPLIPPVTEVRTMSAVADIPPRPLQQPQEKAPLPPAIDTAALLEQDNRSDISLSALDLAFMTGLFLSPYVINDSPVQRDEARKKAETLSL